MPRKLDRVILSSCVSTSGKYRLVLCEHIRNGKFCYDVAGVNLENGLIVTRHYNEASDDSVNKAEALRIFDEYRELLTAPAKPEEGDDAERLIFIKPN